MIPRLHDQESCKVCSAGCLAAFLFIEGNDSMKQYIFKRILISALTLFVIVLILFTLLEFMPGSPFNDEKLTADQLAALQGKYGLDQPFFFKFLNYVKNILHGDFGVSYNIQTNMPVSTLIASRLPISVQIGLQATAVGTVLGLFLGILAALKRNTVLDSLCTGISVLGISLPNFVFALILSYFLGFKLKIFPILYTDRELFRSTILPTISLAMFPAASIARYTRNELIEVLSTDYILLAESKGLGKVRLVVRHALRNSLIGIITVLAPLIVNLLTGSLVVEKAFSIPGIGSLFINAIQSNDYNVVLSISFVYSFIFILMMLLVDILYCVIDPRVHLAKGE